MSSGKRVGRNVVKPLVLAVALALPGTAAVAASMDDVVKTRADQNIDEQYGRDSVYAFSRDAKPLKPEQQGSHGLGFIGDAFHKTTDFMAGAWHKTTGMFTGGDGKTYAANQTQYVPQRYGRAGGYAGSDRVEVIAGTVDTTATANADTVKTGQDLDNAATGTATPVPDQPSSAAVAPTDPTMNSQEGNAVVTQQPSGAAENRDPSMNTQEPSAAVDYTPIPPPVEEPNSAMPRDESQPVITAPAAKEETIVTEPADSSAATDETPLQPLDQSSTGNDDVVHTSPMPPSDNGRADSADTQVDSSAPTR